jgi:hypothetical protein
VDGKILPGSRGEAGPVHLMSALSAARSVLPQLPVAGKAKIKSRLSLSFWIGST